jgi:imidazole glycerol-phosphate synthase subunit HisF
MTGTARQKINEGNKKLEEIFESTRPVLQLGGVAATDPRFAKVAIEAGVRVLEPNHTAISCARSYKGNTMMREAYVHKHEVDFNIVLDVVQTIRRVAREHVFILCGAPGTFDELHPQFEESHGQLLSEAGVDGLFIEKNDLKEVERLTQIAHKSGMLVQSGFQLSKPNMKTAVISVFNAVEARRTAQQLEDLGVDIVAMRLSGIFKSLDAEKISSEEIDCIYGLTESVKAPTAVYAGVNSNNLSTIAKTGVNMVGVASAVDDLLYKSMTAIINEFV